VGGLSSAVGGRGGDEGISARGDGSCFADGGGTAAPAGGGGIGIMTDGASSRTEALAAELARARKGGGGGMGVVTLRGVWKTRRFFGGTSADGRGSHGDGEGAAAAVSAERRRG
jgi:hypothetical protein